MKRKILIIVLLVLLLLLTSALTFAYWASSVNEGNQSAIGSIDIGTGESITVSVSVTETTVGGQILVPAGFAVDAGEVEEVILMFEVTWNSDDALLGIVPASISALVENIKVNNVANPFLLIVVTPDVANPTEIELGSTVTFIFRVTLTAPSNITQYNAVAGLPVTFDITFTVSPN